MFHISNITTQEGMGGLCNLLGTVGTPNEVLLHWRQLIS